MDTEEFTDLAGFYQAVAPYLEKREAENSLLLGLAIANQQRPPDTRMFTARVLKGEETVLAAFYTGFLLILSTGNVEAARELAEHLRPHPEFCPGVVGPVEIAERYAESWVSATGCSVASVKRQRIYELTGVVPPVGVEGRIAVATMDEFDLVFDWSRFFHDEATPDQPFDERRLRSQLEVRIREGQRFLWVNEGRPVCMAGHRATDPSDDHYRSGLHAD